MQFAFSDSMCDPAHYVPLAKAVDALGYHTFPIGDSICYPEAAEGDYPYLESGDRTFLDGAPFIDPFQLVAALATVTQRIRFRTGVLKLPIREPVLVAKQATSLAVWTGNRFELGVGLSPWIEDFRVTHTDWKSRGKRMDQMIEIIRGLTRGDYFEYHSEFYDVPRIKLCPVPSEPLPILYGGHSEPAWRRAARLCDGFTFAGGTLAYTLESVAKLRAYRKEYGKQNEPFFIHAGVTDIQGIDDIRRLEDAGVDELSAGARNPYEPDTLTVEQKIQAAEAFAENVIGPGGW
ncbi:MAG: LLM class flavin-dependent oxidoreductase [Myxococcota bacterium]|nr:LLM class F420-dependent oxidoreductase [Deltaproteobacteria bacterium]MCP4239203.1 LLM class flavin-dependent oxidoreductase [bacterium]MDP6075395.1 LLM class flavin-dependent oxidoreductase [Myxococcota bacterium]MDP6244133.1 LLM class flavin-dependent oxidoreductase [Myxococcota bacterium]MDP7076418.1 LLM class flavin-dependent oxidoreductase [Myxococcota bacterium]